MRKFLLCFAFFGLGVILTLFILFGYDVLPRDGMKFNFETLGVYLGSIGSTGAIFVVIYSTNRQLKQQDFFKKKKISPNIFDKRIEIYWEVKNYFDELIQIKFFNVELYSKHLKDIIKFTEDRKYTFDIKYIYDNNVFKKIKKLISECDNLNKQYNELDKMYNALIKINYADGAFSTIFNNIISDTPSYDNYTKLFELFENDLPESFPFKDKNFYSCFRECTEISRAVENEFIELMNLMEEEFKY